MTRAKLLSASTLEAKLEFGAQEYSITDFLQWGLPCQPPGPPTQLKTPARTDS